MHWTVAGADAIIVLRCKEASSQREAICNHRPQPGRSRLICPCPKMITLEQGTSFQRR